MKHFFLILIIILSLGQLTCKAQFNRKAGEKNKSNRKFIVQLGGGWHFSQTSSDGFDRMIELFNQNAGNTQIQLPELKQMSGPSGVLSIYGNVADGKGPRILVELGYRGYSKKIENTEQLPSIHMKIHEMSLGLGSLFIQSTNFDWGIGAAFNGGLMQYEANKRFGQDKESLTHGEFTAGISVFAPIYIGFGKESTVALSIRPYYQYRLIKNDFKQLNRFINPNTYQEITPETLESPLHSMGVEVQLLFAFKKVMYK